MRGSNASNKVSRFPSFAFGENRLRSTALNKPPPLVPLASLDLPNRGRRVAYGSKDYPQLFGQLILQRSNTLRATSVRIPAMAFNTGVEDRFVRCRTVISSILKESSP